MTAVFPSTPEDVLHLAFHLAEQSPQYREAYEALALAMSENRRELVPLPEDSRRKPVDHIYDALAREKTTVHQAIRKRRKHVYVEVLQVENPNGADRPWNPYYLVGWTGYDEPCGGTFRADFVPELIHYLLPFRLPAQRSRRPLDPAPASPRRGPTVDDLGDILGDL